MSTPLENSAAVARPDAVLLAAFNASADAFIVIDEHQRVLFINRTACSMLGWQDNEALGRHWYEVVQFVAGGPVHNDLSDNSCALRAGSEQTTVRLRVNVDGFSGRWMYHCHILSHADHGMMGEFQVDP